MSSIEQVGIVHLAGAPRMLLEVRAPTTTQPAESWSLCSLRPGGRVSRPSSSELCVQWGSLVPSSSSLRMAATHADPNIHLHGLVTQVVSACDPGTSVTIRLQRLGLPAPPPQSPLVTAS
jgi:hypothetical protein